MSLPKLWKRTANSITWSVCCLYIYSNREVTFVHECVCDCFFVFKMFSFGSVFWTFFANLWAFLPICERFLPICERFLPICERFPGLPLRPMVLFTSIGDLIEMYWSGALQEKTTLLQVMLLMFPHESGPRFLYWHLTCFVVSGSVRLAKNCFPFFCCVKDVHKKKKKFLFYYIRFLDCLFNVLQ